MYKFAPQLRSYVKHLETECCGVWREVWVECCVEAKTTCRNNHTRRRACSSEWSVSSTVWPSGRLTVGTGASSAVRPRRPACGGGHRGRTLQQVKMTTQIHRKVETRDWDRFRKKLKLRESMWKVSTSMTARRVPDLRAAALLVLATLLRGSLFSDFDGRYPRLLIPHGHSIFNKEQIYSQTG